jgi:DNA polymerase-3 subunit beta
MKLISLQKNLKSAIYIVSHIAQKNTNLPILNNILLSVKNGVINLITTNLEVGITTTLRGKVEKEGSFTVDAKILSEYVGLLNNEKITLEVKEKESDLIIDSSNTKTKIKGLSSEEFPFIPQIDRVNPYTFSIKDFKKAVSQVLFSAALDETRAELSGIFFILEGNKATLVATDSYRLAEKKINLKSEVAEEKNCIIPTKTLQEILRVIGVENSDDEIVDDIIFYLSENQCLFVIGKTEIVSRIIDGRYPDYTQIIPQKNICSIELSTQELARAVKAATIFSKNGVNDINFDVDLQKKNIIISAISGQTGEHNSVLEAQIKGENVSIILNSRYILDVLNVLSSDSVIIELVDANTPCVIRDGKNKDYLYIIMPIRK